MKNWWKQLTRKKYYPHVIAFLIPFLACLGICIGNGVYPFGENCILHVDMYHQYCPFFTEFLEKLQNGESLLYSWNLGLGSDFVSLYAYYLASPLNWLLILCPKAHVIEFMTVLILTKIALSGLTFFLFLSYHFQLTGKDGVLHANSRVPAIACGTAYAMCGFVAAYNWNIMWMDCIALAPIMFLGLEKLVKENKVSVYYVSLAVAIVSNYYISIMICLCLVFYFLVLFVSQKEERWGALIRFGIYSLLAGGTAAILLIPEYLILGYSGSQGISFPETVSWYFNLIQELSRNCLTAYVYTGREHWPNLYTGVFTMLCVVLYVFNRRISWKKKIPSLAMLAFFLFSFANNYLDFIWHGLHFPDSLPGRQSFLYSFLILVMSFETIRKWKGNKIWHIVVAFLAGAGVLAAGFMQMDAELVDPLAFYVTSIFLAIYAVILLLCKKSNRTMRRMFRNLAFVVVICELIVNMAVTSFSVTSRTAYTAKMDDYQSLLQQAEEDNEQDGNGFYRVEDAERMTKNDDMLYGYPSGTQFSSLMNINVSHFYQRVLMEGGKNFYCYNGATPLISAMLSVKYMLSDNSEDESPLRTIVGTSGDQVLYKNNYCLPLGFMMNEEEVEAWDNTTGSKIKNINSLGYALGAQADMLQLADCSETDLEGESTIVFHDEGYYYAVYDRCSADTLTAVSQDGTVRNYAKTTHRYLLDLGYHKIGDAVTISNALMENLSFQVYRLDLDVVDQAYEHLLQQTMELSSKTDTHIMGSLDVQKEGRLIFSIPDESGWKLYVDGKEQDIEPFKETFISVHLTEGEHSIELRYMTPGLLDGAAISAVCIGMSGLLMFIRRQKRRIHGKHEE